MEYRKNDILTIDILDCGTEGEGIGRTDGFTVFVKDAVIGDRVTAKLMKVKKTYGYGRLMEVLEPSPFRTEAVCPVARQCGGCQIQNMKYEEQLKFKEKKVRGNLERIGGFQNLPMEPIIGMEHPFRYRNKAQYPIGVNKEGKPIAGFYAGRTHSIMENKDCALGTEINSRVLDIVLSYMEKHHVTAYDEVTGKGLLRHVLIRFGFTSKELMVCLIINGKSLPAEKELIKQLTTIPELKSLTVNVNQKKTNVILGDEIRPLWGETYIEDSIGNICYRISPLSFYQVNPVQTEKLYGKALEYAGLSGNETVWDLYCGIGTISLFLAQKAKQVYGVEIVPQAIEDAKQNARLNQIENAEFYVGKAEEVLPQKYRDEGVRADVIVVDPPRKGCDQALLDTILKMSPDKVVYVSCDSATLARDLRILCDGGYQIERVCPVDMFPMTVHVETVVLLSQRKTDDYIEIDLDLDEMDITSAETKATYREVQQYVLQTTGLMVSNLNIAQIKDKCGFDKRENYNKPRTANSRQPKCTPEKEKAIMDAFRHFGMI